MAVLPTTIMRWNKVTVEKYQQLDHINNLDRDEIEKLALTVCVLWDKTPDEVNDLGEKFLRYARQVERMFLMPPAKVWWPLEMQQDATKINYGQFVEVMFFVKSGLVSNLHHIAASLMSGDTDHHERAQSVLSEPVQSVLQPVQKFMESWEKLLFSYANLFEIEEQLHGIEREKEEPHPFLDQYGWIFSATQIADHERIPLDKVWELPVIQALNDLAYLKSKRKYEEWQAEK